MQPNERKRCKLNFVTWSQTLLHNDILISNVSIKCLALWPALSATPSGSTLREIGNRLKLHWDTHNKVTVTDTMKICYIFSLIYIFVNHVWLFKVILSLGLLYRLFKVSFSLEEQLSARLWSFFLLYIPFYWTILAIIWLAFLAARILCEPKMQYQNLRETIVLCEIVSILHVILKISISNR